MRVRLAHLIGVDKIIAMGDDSVENYIEGAKEKYGEFGVKCKNYDPITENFEFCSRIYADGNSYAINLEKMLMHFVHLKLTSPKDYKNHETELDESLRNHPDFLKMKEHLWKVDYDLETLMSRRAFLQNQDLVEVEGPHNYA
nr:RNA-dependent RNA polymerase [Flumine noda-like virus 18]